MSAGTLRLLSAVRVVVAAWNANGRTDPATTAAQALEDAGLLQSPETAAELEQLRARVTELTRQLAQASEHGAQAFQRAGLNGAEAIRLTARVTELEAAAYEYRVPLGDPGQYLMVRRSATTGLWAITTGRLRGPRVWTPTGWHNATLLADREIFQWPQDGVLSEAVRAAGGAS